MNFSTMVKIAIVVLILYAGWEVASPFIDRYVLTKEVENIATYATVNAVERAEKEFVSRVINKGGLKDKLAKSPIVIERNEHNNTATAILKYKDKIEIFGFLIKEYEFHIEHTAAKVDKKF
jgi:hypothetical protein